MAYLGIAAAASVLLDNLVDARRMTHRQQRKVNDRRKIIVALLSDAFHWAAWLLLT